jgi:hypothetical protein
MAYRHHLLTAAAISVAAMSVVATLSLASPASAAESTSAASEATKVSAAMSVKHRLSRIAAWREHRYVRPIRMGCSSAWCGRQFVLMVGIAY